MSALVVGRPYRCRAAVLVLCPGPVILPRSGAIMGGERFGTGRSACFPEWRAASLRLWWIDPKGEAVDLGTTAPEAFLSVDTFVEHVFALTDTAGRCRRIVRIDDVFSGTFVGTSRYRPVVVQAGWHVLVDRALDPGADPARSALAVIARMPEQADAILPAGALARIRATPIILLDHAGAGSKFHSDHGWLVAHGRSVEMARGIEISDAGVFIETSKVQPGSDGPAVTMRANPGTAPAPEGTGTVRRGAARAGEHRLGGDDTKRGRRHRRRVFPEKR